MGALVVAAVAAWILVPSEHASIPSQLDDELQEASKQGFSVTVNRTMDLHGTGVNSRLIVLQPKDHGLPTSDEVRIYDEVGKDLELRYSARPIARDDLPGYRLRVLGIGRYDQSDREEVIATLDQRFADSRPPHPVALLWNVRQQKYVMRALLPRAPRLPKMEAGVWGKASRRFYRRSENVKLERGSTLRNLRGARKRYGWHVEFSLPATSLAPRATPALVPGFSSRGSSTSRIPASRSSPVESDSGAT